MPTPNELYDQAADLRDQGDKDGAVAKLEEAVALDPEFAIGARDARQALRRSGQGGEGDRARPESRRARARRRLQLYRAFGHLPAVRPHPRGRARQGDGLPETDGIRLIDRVDPDLNTNLGSSAG